MLSVDSLAAKSEIKNGSTRFRPQTSPSGTPVIKKKVVTHCEIAPTSSKKKQRENRSNTLLQVQQFSGEFARWERSWRITSPERLRFRYRPGKTLAVKGFWQISTLPFESHSKQNLRVLLHSGVLPTPKPGEFKLFHINLAKLSTVPKSPPSQPRTYYVRAILLDAKDRCVGHSLSVKIDYSKSGKPTKFTNLPPSIYTLDRDQDGLPDHLERQLAEQFKPYFIFDSAEKARRSKEPVVLFQVRPEGCIGQGCKKPYRVWIRYAALFAKDGGYGPSSDCGNTHNGDHVLIDVIIVNKTGWDSVGIGLRWRLAYIKNWEFEWPSWSAKFYPHQSNFGHRHPIIFLSAHKHHQYFDTNRDEKDSIYSDYGCNDDVNGKGAKIFSNLISPLKNGLPNNVGEPESHNEAYFINSLQAFGYLGENAWSGKPFRGGHGGDGDGAKFKDIWLRHQFHKPSAGK